MIALARAATATVRCVVRSSGQASVGPFRFVSAREIGGLQPDGETAMAIAARQRIVRNRRAAAGRLPRGGAMTVRVGVRAIESRRRWLRRGWRNVAAVERRNGAGPDPFRHGRPSGGASPVSGLVMATSMDHVVAWRHAENPELPAVVSDAATH